MFHCLLRQKQINHLAETWCISALLKHNEKKNELGDVEHGDFWCQMHWCECFRNCEPMILLWVSIQGYQQRMARKRETFKCFAAV